MKEKLKEAAAGSTNTKKKMMSLQVSSDIHEKFSRINKAKGLSNSAVIQMYMAQYVADNQDYLQEK